MEFKRQQPQPIWKSLDALPNFKLKCGNVEKFKYSSPFFKSRLTTKIDMARSYEFPVRRELLNQLKQSSITLGSFKPKAIKKVPFDTKKPKLFAEQAQSVCLTDSCNYSKVDSTANMKFFLPSRKPILNPNCLDNNKM